VGVETFIPSFCLIKRGCQLLRLLHEVVSKIFRPDAEIYTAVVVVRSTGPNRPNCEFRVLCDVLRLLRENVRRRRLELWPEQIWWLYHDNAPSHTSVLAQQFLAKWKMAVIPTHRTHLISHPVTSYFQKWNWSWKDAGLISQRVLDTVTEKDFQEAFHKLRTLWDWCPQLGGKYFEGDGGW
jgi:hypothetical protein